MQNPDTKWNKINQKPITATIKQHATIKLIEKIKKCRILNLQMRTPSSSGVRKVLLDPTLNDSTNRHHTSFSVALNLHSHVCRFFFSPYYIVSLLLVLFCADAILVCAECTHINFIKLKPNRAFLLNKLKICCTCNKFMSAEEEHSPAWVKNRRRTRKKISENDISVISHLTVCSSNTSAAVSASFNLRFDGCTSYNQRLNWNKKIVARQTARQAGIYVWGTRNDEDEEEPCGMDLRLGLHEWNCFLYIYARGCRRDTWKSWSSSQHRLLKKKL